MTRAGGINVSREALRQLLASEPTLRQLRARHSAIARLHAQVVKYIGLRALRQSLEQDMGQLQEWIDRCKH